MKEAGFKDPIKRAVPLHQLSGAFWSDTGSARQFVGRVAAELRSRAFPPSAEKALRRFSSGEAAKLIGVTDAYIRHLSLSGEAPDAEKSGRGRGQFTLDQVHELRRTLARSKPSYLPERRDAEHLQVIAVTNFKGGSGKTPTAAHLAQYFAMRGYRTLSLS
jgi:chromosome partitioning protein